MKYRNLFFATLMFLSRLANAEINLVFDEQEPHIMQHCERIVESKEQYNDCYCNTAIASLYYGKLLDEDYEKNVKLQFNANLMFKRDEKLIQQKNDLLKIYKEQNGKLYEKIYNSCMKEFSTIDKQLSEGVDLDTDMKIDFDKVVSSAIGLRSETLKLNGGLYNKIQKQEE